MGEKCLLGKQIFESSGHPRASMRESISGDMRYPNTSLREQNIFCQRKFNAQINLETEFSTQLLDSTVSPLLGLISRRQRLVLTHSGTRRLVREKGGCEDALRETWMLFAQRLASPFLHQAAPWTSELQELFSSTWDLPALCVTFFPSQKRACWPHGWKIKMAGKFCF